MMKEAALKPWESITLATATHCEHRIPLNSDCPHCAYITRLKAKADKDYADGMEKVREMLAAAGFRRP
jgi:hypothetical protein